MKTFLFALIALSPLTSFAAPEFECEQSAVDYITHIASAPYVNSGEKLDPRDLTLVSRKKSGDGAEAYEHFVYKNKGSIETYKLKLAVEEIGGICPLEKYEVSYR